MRTNNFCFICKTDKSKPVKQEVNGALILPPLVFPAGPDKLECLTLAGVWVRPGEELPKGAPFG